ncbi:MAG: STY4851/ECs_5259 family protein [Gammaproteobacteria bacterium]|nr:STY4851/ECs_5259 family protein [Gammaproteobacteria bacterium]
MTTQKPQDWVDAFLESRELPRPDGRPLYAYRCNGQEFGSLADTLSCQSTYGHIPSKEAVRAFVLYAAEWWQRHYDGRHWAWEPILSSVDWLIDYPDLYGPVRDACRWWKIDLVKLPKAGTRYLGTFACQGGLPLALVRDPQSPVTRYLRAVLKHATAYRQFVDDPIELAQDKQYVLRPPTLRRDYVFRLAADLIETVLDLKDHASGGDPIASLDDERPGWRKNMPLNLENRRARDVLLALIRDARRADSALVVSNFRVERFLRKTAIGWRLGARVALPREVTAEVLAKHLDVSSSDLPLRLQVRIQADQVVVVGIYAKSSDNYLLVPNRQVGSTELWDEQAAREIRLRFVARTRVGKSILPNHGAQMGELPWAFRGSDGDCVLIGEGSVGSRAPEILVLVPHGSTTASETAVEGFVLNRKLLRIGVQTTIDTIHGPCTVRPSSQQSAEADYRLTGQRFFGIVSTWPLYRGIPKLHVAIDGQVRRAVPTKEVKWRKTGGDWRDRPDDAYGLWEVRHVRNGELKYLSRAGILPEGVDLSIQPGNDISEGTLVLAGSPTPRVATNDDRVVLTHRQAGQEVHLRLVASDPTAPPAQVKLDLHWSGGAKIGAITPFPGQGGRFVRDGSLLVGTLAMDDLYGVRASALAADSSQQFRIEAELKALDLGDLLGIANFQRSLEKSGSAHELALFDVRPQVEMLLAASADPNARVVLRIIDRAQNECAKIEVVRFAATLDYESEMTFLSYAPPLKTEAPPVFEALPLTRPDRDPMRLEVVGPEMDPSGALWPQQAADLSEPWLAVVRHGGRMRVQPVSIGGKRDQLGVRDAPPPRLAQALDYADQGARERALTEAMDTLVSSEAEKFADSEWAFLTDALLRAEDLPATSLDLLRVLVTKPKLLVRCIFRLESAPRNLLWRLRDELPFSWLLIPRKIWWEEAKLECSRIRSQLADRADAEHIAQEHIGSILDEGADHHPGLHTVATDCRVRLAGGAVSSEFVEAVVNEMKQRLPEQIRLRANMDDWPMGYGRKEWRDELKRGELLDQLGQPGQLGLWLDPESHRARQPIFDTPVVAAWCCIFDTPTNRTAFLVKRIQAHDPDWFVAAYNAAWWQLAHKADQLPNHG